MELCFALHNVWTVEECHAYAELSLVGGVKVFITDLFKATDDESKALKAQYLEKYGEQRNVDGYVWLIHREYIGQTRQLSREKEQEVARIKLCNLQLCDLRDNTIGERIQYVTDQLKYMKEAFDDQKTASKALKNLSLGIDFRDEHIPVQWGCRTSKNSSKPFSKKKLKKYRQKAHKEKDFRPIKLKKYKFRKSKTFKELGKKKRSFSRRNSLRRTILRRNEFLTTGKTSLKRLPERNVGHVGKKDILLHNAQTKTSKQTLLNAQTFKGKAPLEEETMELDFHDFENQKCWYAGTQGFLDKVKPGLYWQFDLKWSNQLVQCDRCKGMTTGQSHIEDCFMIEPNFKLIYHRHCFLLMADHIKQRQTGILNTYADFWKEVEENRMNIARKLEGYREEGQENVLPLPDLLAKPVSNLEEKTYQYWSIKDFDWEEDPEDSLSYNAQWDQEGYEQDPVRKEDGPESPLKRTEVPEKMELEEDEGEDHMEVQNLNLSGPQLGFSPAIRLKIAKYNDKSFIALIDTGAVMLLTGPQLVPANLISFSPEGISGGTANAGKFQSQRITKTLFLEVEKSPILLEQKFWVIEEFTSRFDAILGMDFIDKYFPVNVQRNAVSLSIRKTYDLKIPRVFPKIKCDCPDNKCNSMCSQTTETSVESLLDVFLTQIENHNLRQVQERRDQKKDLNKVKHDTLDLLKTNLSTSPTDKWNVEKPTCILVLKDPEQTIKGYCAYLDVENAMDPSLAESMGVNTENLLLSRPDSAENLLSVVNTLVKSGSIDVIVVDSVAAFVPQCELDVVIDGNCSDVRSNLRSCHGFGNSDEVSCGGNALKFYSAVRMRIIRTRLLKTENKITGLGVCVQVVKNKLAPAMKKAELEIRFGRGICCESEVLDMACKHGVILKEGNKYCIEGEIFNDKDEAEQYLAENDEILEKLVTILRNQLFES
ncbi:hypothetical protein HHK36_011840 [Tetracentron sinense]|uniref:RecA family profile 2 domain-containing protein n=1 Tax=Tetracentron sinense TaxID=13715 RepID=A0A834ZCC8_TETSI|nr:hypothetical protein HHK36_011840 [Tetracentron sinense]